MEAPEECIGIRAISSTVVLLRVVLAILHASRALIM